MSQTHDGFNEWVTQRSFTLLKPVCHMSLAILVAMFLVVDPVFYFLGFWDKNIQYLYMAAWHVGLALFFITTLLASRFSQSHASRYAVLQFFFIGVTTLFVWSGVNTWFLAGEFSFYAVAILCTASVFCFPGRLRQVLYVLSAVAMSGIILVMDKDGAFLAGGILFSLASVVAVAFLIDGHDEEQHGAV